jgi:hypothetical protein
MPVENVSGLRFEQHPLVADALAIRPAASLRVEI